MREENEERRIFGGLIMKEKMDFSPVFYGKNRCLWFLELLLFFGKNKTVSFIREVA